MQESRAAGAVLRLAALTTASFALLAVSAQDASEEDENPFQPPCAQADKCNRC